MMISKYYAWMGLGMRTRKREGRMQILHEKNQRRRKKIPVGEKGGLQGGRRILPVSCSSGAD